MLSFYLILSYYNLSYNNLCVIVRLIGVVKKAFETRAGSRARADDAVLDVSVCEKGGLRSEQ